jgi:hypothetical protein
MIARDTATSWANRHSGDGRAKIVAFLDPKRGALNAREHWKHGNPAFAARQN